MRERIVVKIGSSSLTSEQGGLNKQRIDFFAGELSRLQRAGHEVLLVTSGAVAAGFRRIGYEARPRLVHEKQAAAAVGQALLMQAYQEAFGRDGIGVAQILLTRSDFSNRKRIHNAQMTLDELLCRGILPIINENDTVATAELKFGDNDTLSALVANLVKAKQLLILTDTDGLYTADPRTNPQASRIARVDKISEEIERIAGGAGSSVGTGGMRSKIDAARIAMRGGIPAFVGKLTEDSGLLEALDGQGHGTYFDTAKHSLPMKKQWVGFHSTPRGVVVIDEGAEAAIIEKGKSLLPAGVLHSEGEFHPGDVIEVKNSAGRILGRGVVNYSYWQVQAAAGLGSEEVRKRLDVGRIEIIHRDEWVAFEGH